MKKLLTSLLITISLFQLSSVGVTYAELSEEEITKSLEADASIVANDLKIKNTQEKIDEVTKKLNTENLEEEKVKIQKELKTLTDEKKELEKKNDDIRNSTDYKLGKIDDDFSKKIRGTTEKGTEIGKDCTQGSEKPACQDFELRQKANEEYVEFLKKQRDHELCRARLQDPAEVSSCNEAKKAMEAAANVVRGTVADIADAEKKRNMEETFEVSRIFSLNEEGEERRSILQVASQIADWMILLVSSLAVTALIIGGFMMIISGGDETRLEEGKTIFTYSLIGLAVTLLAYGIVSIIQGLFYS